jgi:hypothetical protein
MQAKKTKRGLHPIESVERKWVLRRVVTRIAEIVGAFPP